MYSYVFTILVVIPNLATLRRTAKRSEWNVRKHSSRCSSPILVTFDEKPEERALQRASRNFVGEQLLCARDWKGPIGPTSAAGFTFQYAPSARRPNAAGSGAGRANVAPAPCCSADGGPPRPAADGSTIGGRDEHSFASSVSRFRTSSFRKPRRSGNGLSTEDCGANCGGAQPEARESSESDSCEEQIKNNKMKRKLDCKNMRTLPQFCSERLRSPLKRALYS